MIGADRELLARLARVNQGIARSVPELLRHLDGGALPSAGLRALARSLSEVAGALSARADEIDHVVDVVPRTGPDAPGSPATTRMTLQTRLVLQALLADPGGGLFGTQIAAHTGLLPGTTYPILHRLERIGWVRAWWEDIDPHVEGRPRRRYWRLTPAGITAGRQQARLERSGASER